MTNVASLGRLGISLLWMMVVFIPFFVGFGFGLPELVAWLGLLVFAMVLTALWLRRRLRRDADTRSGSSRPSASLAEQE